MAKVDWRILTAGALLASLGLSACGGATKATLDEAVTSLSSSPYAQMKITANVSGAGFESGKVKKALSLLSYNLLESSTTGSPLSQSVGKINTEVDIDVGTQSLAAVREVGSTLYIQVDATALAKIPGVTVSPQELSGIQLLFGGRWFEIPQSLINSYIPSTTKIKAPSAKDQVIVHQIVNDVTSVIEATKYTTLPNGGFSETGPLSSIVKAVQPTLDKLTGSPIHPGKVRGTYTVGLTLSGSTATAGSIKITAPNGAKGNASVALNATVAHASNNIEAPTGATVINPNLLKGLLGQVSPGLAATAGG